MHFFTKKNRKSPILINQQVKIEKSPFSMKTPLPKFPHHRGVPKHHFGDKTPLLATLKMSKKALKKADTKL